MVTEEFVLQKVQESNDGGRTHTLAEFIASVFKDKFIEIYLGDSYEEVSVEQISTAYPAVFVGKVITAYRECLVLNCAYADQRSKSVQLGHMMFINERAIRGLNEVTGNGVLEDMFLRSKESVKLSEQFGEK